MGDHMDVFHSLRDLFPQVDPRMLKAVAIEHHKDVDSAVVAVLDEVMPFIRVPDGIPCAHNEAVPSMSNNIAGAFSAGHDTRETGSSSSAGHDVRCDEANGSVESAQCTSSTMGIINMQENVVGELDVNPSYQEMNGQLNFTSYHVLEVNDEQHALTNLDDLFQNLYFERNIAHSDNELRHGGYLSSAQSVMEENGSDNINLNGAHVHDEDTDNTILARDYIDQDNYLISGIDGFTSEFWSEKSLTHSNNEVGDCITHDNSLKFLMLDLPINGVSSGRPTIEKDVSTPTIDFPIPGIEEPSVGSGCVLELKDTNSSGTDYNKQMSGNIAEHVDPFLSTKTYLLPDLNLNHFPSMASTHSSHSVSIELLEESIADAKNNKHDVLPSLELVTKMIGDVELLEEKAKVAKHEASISGTSILTKVEELKGMLNHAKEANDMHAGEVFGEKSILTTEARGLQSRLERLSDERDSYLVVIEEIRQTLEERLVAAQQEIEAAEKEKIEKEAFAGALLNEQDKEMSSIVEESIRLQEEAEENLKLKAFLVERGRIVDTLQGEMAVICEDVSQLKRIVDERLSWSKLQRSTMSGLSSSLHSSLHKSASSSDRTAEAVEPTDKHTVAEDATLVFEDLNLDERTVKMFDGCDYNNQENIIRHDCKEEGWELC